MSNPLSTPSGPDPLRTSQPLVDRLPLGALTLVTLGAGQRPGHWPTLMGHLAVAPASHGKPVLYVMCGGGDHAPGWVLAEAATSGLLSVSNDQDLTVAVPSGGVSVASGRLAAPSGLPHWDSYSCNIPTVHVAWAALRALEAQHGPALLILDEVDLARPYRQACNEYAAMQLPNGLILSPDHADAWRAGDLADVAKARPFGATVAVLHHPSTAPGVHEALLQVALCSIAVMWRPESGTVLFTSNTRDQVVDAWRAAWMLEVAATALT